VAVWNWIFIGSAELQDIDEECCLLGLNACKSLNIAHFCAKGVSVEVIVAFCHQYLKLNRRNIYLQTALLLCCVSNNVWFINDNTEYYPEYGAQSLLLHQSPPISRYAHVSHASSFRCNFCSVVDSAQNTARENKCARPTEDTSTARHIWIPGAREDARNVRYVKGRPITARTFRPQRKSSAHNLPLQQGNIWYFGPLNHNDKYMHHLT
jgi:hypothetical protein